MIILEDNLKFSEVSCRDGSESSRMAWPNDDVIITRPKGHVWLDDHILKKILILHFFQKSDLMDFPIQKHFLTIKIKLLADQFCIYVF